MTAVGRGEEDRAQWPDPARGRGPPSLLRLLTAHADTFVALAWQSRRLAESASGRIEARNTVTLARRMQSSARAF